MFRVFKTDDGRNCPIEYLPAGAIALKLGMALTVSAGKLAIASGTTRPSYISMTETPGAVAAGTVVPVIRVSEDVIYNTVVANISSISEVPASRYRRLEDYPDIANWNS